MDAQIPFHLRMSSHQSQGCLVSVCSLGNAQTLAVSAQRFLGRLVS